MNKQTKARIFILIYGLVVGLVSALGLSTFMFQTLEKLPIHGKDFFPHIIIGSIQQNQKHGLMFATMVFLFALIIVFIVISVKDKNQFASELDKITDKISTPKRVGQFQHGRAQWLEKRNLEKTFFKYSLKMEGIYQYLVLLGRKDIENIQNLERIILKKIKKLPKDMSEETRDENIFLIISEVIEDYVSKKEKFEQEKQRKAIANNTQPEPLQKHVLKKEVANKSKKTKNEESSDEESSDEESSDDNDTLSMYIGQSFLRNAGLVVHYSKSKKQENIFCLEKDVHSIILGSTGSNKTRSLILQTICLLALSGESIVMNDPKGEIFQYTNVYLKRLGYDVIVIDFRDRELSQRYNFLQPIIQATNEGDINKAVDLAWDITSSLVGETQGERIWHDGECCVIASAIICVVLDNKDNPQYQNLTNVYYFIANMCQPGEKGVMPLDLYLKTLDDTHPAKGILAQAKVAPSRTRGSFLTSALSTLKLFTNPNTFNMTCESDFLLWDIGKKKTAFYMILPDAKTTFYPLASLFVYQLYVELAEKSEQIGGRLNIRVNMILEEFGNFAKIPAIENMLSVARGRGIRFNLVLQSYSQLAIKYNKEISNVIKANCQCKILLKTDESDTVKDISNDLGNYTTSSFSRSASTSSTQSSNNSNSMNLISRPLLTTDQVKQVDRPYALVMHSGFDPFMATLPDLSKWSFNIALGMGDENHNLLLCMVRQKERKAKPIKEIVLWKLWERYLVTDSPTEETKQKSVINFSNHMDYLEKDWFGIEDTSNIKTPEERLEEEKMREKREKNQKEKRIKETY